MCLCSKSGSAVPTDDRRAPSTESLTLTWSNVDLDAQTAYLPETSIAGRCKAKLPQRTCRYAAPVASQAVNSSSRLGVDGLRRHGGCAWPPACLKCVRQALRIHDLRHESHLAGRGGRQQHAGRILACRPPAFSAVTATCACCCVTPISAPKVSPRQTRPFSSPDASTVHHCRQDALTNILSITRPSCVKRNFAGTQSSNT